MGFAQLADQYGPWFTHSGSPRAKIFARDHHKITDIDSMIFYDEVSMEYMLLQLMIRVAKE